MKAEDTGVLTEEDRKLVAGMRAMCEGVRRKKGVMLLIDTIDSLAGELKKAREIKQALGEEIREKHHWDCVCDLCCAFFGSDDVRETESARMIFHRMEEDQ